MTPSSGPGPRRLVLRLVLSLLGSALLVGSTGCSHASTNLAGHWRGVRAEGVQSDIQDATNAFAVHMRVDVDGNAITVTTAKDTKTDHYTLVQEDKTHTIITTDLDGASDPQTFFFTDATTMKWAVTQTQVVVFAKQ